MRLGCVISMRFFAFTHIHTCTCLILSLSCSFTFFHHPYIIVHFVLLVWNLFFWKGNALNSPNTSCSLVPCVLDCAFTKKTVPKLLSVSYSKQKLVPSTFITVAKEIPCNIFVHAHIRPWPFDAKDFVLLLSFAFAVHTVTSTGGQDMYLGVKC